MQSFRTFTIYSSKKVFPTKKFPRLPVQVPAYGYHTSQFSFNNINVKQSSKNGSNNNPRNNPFTILTLCIFIGGVVTLAAYDKSKFETEPKEEILATTQSTVTDRAFFDIQINDESPQRIIIGLYGKDYPELVERFKMLCNENSSDNRILAQNKTLQMTHIFYRFLSIGNPKTPHLVSEQKQGEAFKRDTNFKHLGLGVVSVSKSAEYPNYYIFFRASPSYDQFYLVIGQVLSGLTILKSLESLATLMGTPDPNVKIVNCGVVSVEDILEEQLQEDL